jgi:PAS domain S-box-containing protein
LNFKNILKIHIISIKPAIALMNNLKYPHKFFLISVLFVLPLALVMNFLISELDSRIEFTEKELYGSRYLRPISQLWQHIPQRQMLLQQESYNSFLNDGQGLVKINPALTEELQNSTNKINQEFANLSILEKELREYIKTNEKIKNIQLKWQNLDNNQKVFNSKEYDLLLTNLKNFRIYIVDASNLILDPDLDTYYLMDAIALKLPEMQKLLYRIMQTEAEAVSKQKLTSENKALLISLISLLEDYNNDLNSNLERAFSNNPRGNLRNSLSMPLRNFIVNINDFKGYINQLVTQDEKVSLRGSFYQEEMENTIEESFVLWRQTADHLDQLLIYRIQDFKVRKYFILIFVALVLISIIYLFIGFYLSVMQTVFQLDIAAKKMTSGGEISIRLDSKDELSMVVQSFNSVAIALRESEEKYRSIFENSVDGIFQTTVTGQYLSANLALAKIYGYESVGQMLIEIADTKTQLYVEADRRQQFQELMEVNSTITNFESQAYKRDRTMIWISENVRALRDQNNQIIYYEGTVEDISQRKIAEIGLANANQQILSLNNQLKEENLRMGSELAVTRKLQQMILPKDQELAMILGLDIAGFMEPADEVGGDYYDVLQQNGKIKIGIGDVTGHGLESGMLMIMVQTAVRTLLQNEENDPVRFLDTLNRTIYGNVQRMSSDKNLTLALIDYEHGKLTLSGQHEEMIVVRKNGDLERFDTADLGFPIGLEEEISSFLAEKKVDLFSGDVVVLYTDGITEAENEQRQLYGLERLCEVICENVNDPASAIRQAVIADLRSHIGTQKIYDDITLLVLKQR